MRFLRSEPTMVDPADALPGRPSPMPVAPAHLVTGNPMTPPWPDGSVSLLVGMGCFWGAERAFWEMDGVWTTAVGYAGGFTPNPTYEEVCSGRTGHTEAVLVVAAPEGPGLETLLATFWERHDPTQGMRQGNDIGTQYRSACWWTEPAQAQAVQASWQRYADALAAAGKGPITTEIGPAPAFFYAEDYHQQYLAKNPGGYCGLGGTGVTCPPSSG